MPERIVPQSDIAVPRTTSRWLWVYVQAKLFCNMWNNRGLIGATSWTISRMATGVIDSAWKAASFTYWLTSRPASRALQDERNLMCDECDAVELTPHGTRYCSGCGCPKTKWSELTMKNSRQGHNCPLGKHRGSKRLGVFGGCKNCGKKKAAEQEPQKDA